MSLTLAASGLFLLEHDAIKRKANAVHMINVYFFISKSLYKFL